MKIPKFELNVPNVFTLARGIAAMVALGWFAYNPSLTLFFVVGAMMALDVVDGWLARTLHQESDFGRWLDPVLDKAVAFEALGVLLWLLKLDQPLLSLVCLVILACDVLIARVGAKNENIGMKPSPVRAGKYGMFARNCAIMLIMLYICWSQDWPVVFGIFGLAFIGVTLGFIARAEYLSARKEHLRLRGWR